MKKRDLLARIEALEARLAAVEARPMPVIPGGQPWPWMPSYPYVADPGPICVGDSTGPKANDRSHVYVCDSTGTMRIT